MSKVLIADPINDSGVQKLTDNGHHVDIKVGLPHEELIKIIDKYDALIVRSETKVTANIIKHAKSPKIRN